MHVLPEEAHDEHGVFLSHRVFLLLQVLHERIWYRPGPALLEEALEAIDTLKH